MLPWSQWFCCVHIAQCNFLLVCIAERTCHIHNQQSWVSLLWPGAPSCRELCKREHATRPVRVTYPEYVQIHFLVASGCLLLYKASGFAQKGVRVRFRQHTHIMQVPISICMQAQACGYEWNWGNLAVSWGVCLPTAVSCVWRSNSV